MKYKLLIVLIFTPFIIGCLNTSKGFSSLEKPPIIFQIYTSHKSQSISCIDELIEAMIWVESRGIDSAYNSKENAIGCLQIRPIMIREINRLSKKKDYPQRWVHADAWDCAKSIEMFKIWAKANQTEHLFERSARNWNGGPKGWKKNLTIGYWNKCKQYAYVHF